ncbi:MAG TPA: alpha-2-macroglobulin family protein, partial [Pyrinomonadaceae bacterium]|nr:alpha-2-macroglobulin family protein [Pyrinomonadaceae bacterium]
KSFGKGQANLTTKKELMVKPSPPRFLNVGDRFELPIVIENQGEKDVPTELAVRWLNAKYEKAQVNNPSAPENNSAEPFNQQSEHFTGRKVIVPAGNRVEVRIPLKTEKAGSFRFQSLAVAGGFNDAAQVEVPVLTPATTEAFATYGNTDKNSPIIQPISIPQNVYPQFGGLEITASSTQLQELTDAFISLAEYKFDCTEQIASRVLSIAALADVLYAFKSGKMPDRATLESYVNRDIEKMLSRQRDDGSFGLWSKEGESYNFPFVSVHAAHALAIAKQKGFKVPDAAIKASLDYLENINETTDEIYKNLPEISLTIRAYALYVRSLLGDADLAEIEHLIKSSAIEKMPFEAIGWILSTSSDNRLKDNPVAVNLRQQIIRFLQNRSTETAATAHFVTDYKDNGWTIMASSRRADAILLDALLRAVPQNDLIPKLVRGLLDNRKKGEWANTQENVFVLLAMDRYFGTFEKQTPEFLLRIWLGDKLIGEKNFSGRSADSGVMMVPMSQLINAKDQTLLMSKNGPGRLYYRIGLNYAPKNLKLPAVDYGFTVIRSYQAVDDPADVQKLSDGTWQIKAGARVRVRLVLTAPSRRYHVALVDNLPAGFEILNPELLNTASQGRDESDRQQNGWWAWFDHQNLRDDRAEVFTSLLYGDTYEYTFLARATTPGEFIAPPAKAEEMYHPETFGRSATETVIIK